MHPIPKDPKKLKARIRSYERKIRREYEETGYYGDGYGKRYLLGSLYMLLGDLEGAVKYFEWYEATFPHDIGEPSHYLCWALVLYRSGDVERAVKKLRRPMLSNLYLIPHLIDDAWEELDIWHNSNMEEPDYLQYIPAEFFSLWDEEALQWVRETYHSPEMAEVRERYIDIERQLVTEPRGPKHSQLVEEALALEHGG